MGKHEMPKKRKKSSFRRKALLVIMLMVIGFCAYTIWDILRPPEIAPPADTNDEVDPVTTDKDPTLPTDTSSQTKTRK
ncbi:MAG: hypothetical protein VB078_05685, partial [Clostridiaceae bacterium]|nr:hypothetical protein [Clostridiaceae bacterium]